MFKISFNFSDSVSLESKVKAIFIGLVILVYAIVLFLLPIPQNPIVSLQSLEEHIWGPSIAGSLPPQLSDPWFYVTVPLSLLALAMFANFTIDLLSTNRLFSALGICLVVGLVATPLLFGFGTDVFSAPIGALLCLISSLFASVAAWVVLILASFLFSKEDKFFEEIKNDFVAGVEAERAKAPTE